MKNKIDQRLLEKIRKHPFMFRCYCIYTRSKHKMSGRHFRGDMKLYEYRNVSKDFVIDKKNNMPMLYDYYASAGKVDGHYFLQDLYFARKVIENINPDEKHFDIGSRVDGFISHLLVAKQKVVQMDVRPLNIKLAGLEFRWADATNLDGIEDGSINSISSLHAIEHFGLGRYGDEIDPDAWKKILASMKRVMKQGGKLYLSVPVGNEQKICFNAHRIFSPQTIINELTDMKLLSWAYVHDGRIIEGKDVSRSKLGSYDCGMFIFEK